MALSGFRHQVYTNGPPSAPFEVFDEPQPVTPKQIEFRKRLASSGAAFASAGVAAVYLVHGTFVGNDLAGVIMGLDRLAPGLAGRLGRARKTITDVLTGEGGNYVPRFADEFESGINQATEEKISVKRFVWSGQNNHIARADGAIRLLNELACFAGSLPPEKLEAVLRVQLWGHSHGGNVLALLSWLLASDNEQLQALLHAARDHRRSWWGARRDTPHWEEAESILQNESHPVRRLQLDMVSFGAPIRHAWAADGYAKLLHFVNHRPRVGLPAYTSDYGRGLLTKAFFTDRDSVQQVGIAGSDFPPLLIGGRTFVADWRLRRFFEQDLGPGWLLSRLRAGKKVAEQGKTLLVDYRHYRGGLMPSMRGHWVYTLRSRLPWHAEVVAREFYGAATESEGAGDHENAPEREVLQ
ncbi:MAG: hypothetical protein AAGA92_00875 [Planctomycetota bacterium]